MDLFTFETQSHAGGLAPGKPHPAFDAKADGIVPGEGVGVVLLKRLSDARRDGDPIRAVLRGVGVCSNMAAPDQAIEPAMRRALVAAGAAPEDAVAIETSGGTATADRHELDAIARVLGTNRPVPVRVGSVVATIGHCGAAMGMASLIKGSLALEKQLMPVGVKVNQPSEAAIQRRNAVQLAQENLPLNTKDVDRPQWVGVTAGAESGQAYHVIVEHGFDTPVKRSATGTQPATAATQPATADLAVAKSKPRIAWMFSGQGSQYPGMLRKLVSEFPPAAAAMDRVDRAMAKLGYGSFAELAWEKTAGLGVDIWQTQIVTLLAEYILAESLTALGVRPDVVAGHSFGEYAANLAAGAWTLETAIQCTRLRADALSRLRASFARGHAGGECLARGGPPNHPANGRADLCRQLQHSRANRAVRRTRGHLPRAELAKQAGYMAMILPVPCAYHSPLMAGAAQMFADRLPGIRIQSARVPVVSTASARYMSDAADIRQSLVDHLTNPVPYVEMVRKIADEAPTAFVEVGPQQVLTKLHNNILAAHSFKAIVASDNSRAPGLETLMAVVAMLKGCGALESVTAPAPIVVPAAAPQKAPVAGPKASLYFDATERRRQARLARICGATPRPPVPSGGQKQRIGQWLPCSRPRADRSAPASANTASANTASATRNAAQQSRCRPARLCGKRHFRSFFGSGRRSVISSGAATDGRHGRGAKNSVARYYRRAR